MTDHLMKPESAAGIASRILIAWHSGQCAGLEEQLAQGHRVFFLSSITDAFEMEKLEALEGALECLQSGAVPHARVRAAIRLLEHLAIQSRAEI